MIFNDRFAKIAGLERCPDWVVFWLEETIRLPCVTRLFPMARDSMVEISYNICMLHSAKDFQVCSHESSDDSTLSGPAQSPAGR